MRLVIHCCVFFFKQKTAYEMRISDWSSDVCSSDLRLELLVGMGQLARAQRDAGLERAVERLLARTCQHPFGDVLDLDQARHVLPDRSEEHTSDIQSLMRISYAVFCLKKKTSHHNTRHHMYSNM